MSASEVEALFEIREYLNEDGAISESEVLDVTKEYNLLAKMTEESSSNNNNNIKIEDDQEFIRDISLLSNENVLKNTKVSDMDFSFLDSFESSENISLKSKSSESDKKDKISTESKKNEANGWKSGFLNNNKSSKQKKSVSIEEIKNTENSLSQTSVNSNNNSKNIDPPKIKEDSKNVPFTGQILERFPKL